MSLLCFMGTKLQDEVKLICVHGHTFMAGSSDLNSDKLSDQKR